MVAVASHWVLYGVAPVADVYYCSWVKGLGRMQARKGRPSGEAWLLINELHPVLEMVQNEASR